MQAKCLLLFFSLANVWWKTRASSQSPPSIPQKFLGMDVHGDPVMLPLVGAGTWQYNDTTAYQSVCKAFQAGYTFVDTAFGYGNQRGVGKAIKDCWQGERSELFVMTKIPGKMRIHGRVEKSV